MKRAGDARVNAISIESFASILNFYLLHTSFKIGCHMITKNENIRGFKSVSTIRKIHDPKPPKPADRPQNAQTARPAGKTVWAKAHWRFNYDARKYEWVEGAYIA